VSTAVRCGMDQTARFQEILRRLAIIDESCIEDQTGLRLRRFRNQLLDSKTAALVQMGALAATGSPEVCLEWSTNRAGLGRVVGAVTVVAAALGYDIDAALEDPDDH